MALLPVFTAGSYEELVSDVDPNGAAVDVDGLDAVAVLQFIVGIIDVFDIQTGVTNPHPYKRIGEERLLALGTPQVEGRRMSLPLMINESDEVLAGKLKLNFDPEQYKITGVVLTDHTRDYVIASNVVDDELIIAFAGAQSHSVGEASLLQIQVEAIGQVDEQAPLTFAEATLNGGGLQTRTVEDIHSFSLPEAYTLLPNWPNPFNPETSLRYSLPQAGVVQLVVYDMLGQKVRTLVDNHQEAGAYTVPWDGHDSAGRAVASGTYFYRIQAEGFSKTRKMTLLR